VEEWGDRILNLTDVATVAERRNELLDFWTSARG
jgi:hypothetical protein